MTRDQEERDVARLELGSNIVVEAGAGTGKTTLLTDRILFTLLAGGPAGKGVPIERVVALTFTNKAAGEIKVRLSSALLDILNPDKIDDERRRVTAQERLDLARARFKLGHDAVKRAALRAMEDMDRSVIGTIHHFAAGLLRRYPVEAKVDPRFEVDTNGEAGFAELFESEWTLWLDGELGIASPRRQSWLEVLRLASLEDIKSVALTLSAEGIGHDSARASPAVREKLLALAESVRGLSRLEGKVGPRVAENLKLCPDHFTSVASAMTEPLSLPEEVAAAPFGGGKEGSRLWPEEARAAYARALAAAKGTSPQAESLVRKAVALTAAFARDFSEKYTRAGWVSNDGLLAKALALVAGHPDIREEIKSEIDALLIDEFQDTDPLQGELLFFLAEAEREHASRWQDARLKPGKLFVVGDPKQSIYRFRGADIRAYSRFTALMVAQGALQCRLQTSFRSSAGIVGPVNAIFSKLMPGSGELQPRYLEIYPCPRKDENSSVLDAVELALAGDPSDAEAFCGAEESRRREAAWIARWIRKNCAAAGVPKPGLWRLADVALLARSTSPLSTYIQAFKDADIPYVVESDKHFFEAQEILDAINLLSVIDDPHDDISLAGLLRSPLAALQDQELYALRLAGRLDISRDPAWRAKLTPAARERVRRFYGLLRRLHAEAGAMPLSEFVRRALAATFLAELGAASYSRSQTASNIEKFARLAADAGDGRGATLKEFVLSMKRSIAEAQDEGESPLADDHLDAVRILTIHKAKGLEFPVVILPNLGASPKSGTKSRVRRDWTSGTVGLYLPQAKAGDAASALLGLEEEEIETFQRVRLLYVAMTRAKEKLILMGAAKAGGTASCSGMLAEAAAWAPAGSRPRELALPGGIKLPVHYIADEAPPPSSGPAGLRESGELNLKSLGRLWMNRLKERDRLSEPSVMTPTDGALSPPKPAASRARLEEEAALFSEVRPGAREAALIGEICHRVLERWDYSKAGKVDPLLGNACRALSRTNPGQDWERLGHEAEKILKSFLRSTAAQSLSRCEILGREIPFVFPMDGRLMRGSIDLLYRENGRLWVVDYKAGARPKKTDTAVRERYRAQGEAYTRAVESAGWGKPRFKLLFLRTGEFMELEVQA